ncbi:MAG: alpha/beta hydrolase, partial [Acidobacteriota bacterium]
PSPDGDYTVANYVRFVSAMLDKLGVDHCILVGNSFGGLVSWATALALPERIEKLILVDSAGYAQRSTSVPIGFRIAQMPVLNRLMEVTLPRSFVESSVRNVYGDSSKVTSELVDRYFELTLREGNRRALVQRFKQSSSGEMANQINKLKLPTLILWGGRDRLIPPDRAEQFHHEIAGSQLVMFDDLGHIPQEEDPLRTVVIVKQFLGLE